MMMAMLDINVIIIIITDNQQILVLLACTCITLLAQLLPLTLAFKWVHLFNKPRWACLLASTEPHPTAPLGRPSTGKPRPVWHPLSWNPHLRLCSFPEELQVSCAPILPVFVPPSSSPSQLNVRWWSRPCTLTRNSTVSSSSFSAAAAADRSLVETCSERKETWIRVERLGEEVVEDRLDRVAFGEVHQDQPRASRVVCCLGCRSWWVLLSRDPCRLVAEFYQVVADRTVVVAVVLWTAEFAVVVVVLRTGELVVVVAAAVELARTSRTPTECWLKKKRKLEKCRWLNICTVKRPLQLTIQPGIVSK